MKVLFASDGSDCADRAARFLITSLDKAIKNLRVTLFYVDAPVLDRVAAALGERRIAEIHQENSDACLKGARRRLKRSGLRFDESGHSIVYAIDFSNLTDEMAQLYQGADVWIADCLTRSPHPTHAHLDGVLAWARDLRVGQLYLTHMGNGLDYRTLIAELPDWAAPAHDGLEIQL